MAVRVDHSVFDGTTGRTEHGGRRTHIIRLLRDTKEPLTVEQVAKRVGLPSNTARFHLESLVDSGFATREAQSRSTPGRPKVAYTGTLPNQTHERAQGFRLLAEIMAITVAQSNCEADEWMYQVGSEWGRFLAPRTDPGDPVDEAEILERLIDKLDALWFAPEKESGDPPRLTLHHCPFWDSTRRHKVLCQLHVGMVNGSLEEMKSCYRVTRVLTHDLAHKCEVEFSQSTTRLSRATVEYAPRTPQS